MGGVNGDCEELCNGDSSKAEFDKDSGGALINGKVPGAPLANKDIGEIPALEPLTAADNRAICISLLRCCSMRAGRFPNSPLSLSCLILVSESDSFHGRKGLPGSNKDAGGGVLGECFGEGGATDDDDSSCSIRCNSFKASSLKRFFGAIWRGVTRGSFSSLSPTPATPCTGDGVLDSEFSGEPWFSSEPVLLSLRRLIPRRVAAESVFGVAGGVSRWNFRGSIDLRLFLRGLVMLQPALESVSWELTASPLEPACAGVEYVSMAV